jgi:predicted TIM-barrel fold metal-dependent hydrolase
MRSLAGWFHLTVLSITVFSGSACRHLPNSTVGSETAEAVPGFSDILKIDVHSHIFEDLPQLNEMMLRNNVQIINICNRGKDGHLETMHRIALDLYQAHPNLFPFASSYDLTRFEENGYSKQVIAWLEKTYQNGAVMTKIWKEIGMDLRRKDGSFVLPDDPVFDPIYAFMARRGKPLMAHLAEPIDAWLPLDPKSAHYGYYSSNPQWHLYGKPEFPSHAALIASRDRILQRHPKLIVIGAHLGSLEHDVDEVARRLDQYPNFYVDCSARTRDLTRQPTEKVRNFFIKYQDRILYGVDVTWKPFLEGPRTDAQRKAFVNRLEERHRADYRFYAGTGVIQYDGRSVEGLGLPAKVLEKFYHENARRIILRKR